MKEFWIGRNESGFLFLFNSDPELIDGCWQPTKKYDFIHYNMKETLFPELKDGEKVKCVVSG